MQLAWEAICRFAPATIHLEARGLECTCIKRGDTFPLCTGWPRFAMHLLSIQSLGRKLLRTLLEVGGFS
jgi:hypothetical protein